MARAPKANAPKPGRNTEIDGLLGAAGYSQQQAADYLTRRLGKDYHNYDISRMASGSRKVNHEEMDALRELAAAPIDSPPAVVNMGDTDDIVPLFGYANAAGGTLRINDDQRVGVVPIHPAQRGSRQAYAFICFGDSVSPRLNHGEVGYAVRNKTPFVGQLCVIRLTNGDALVKFYEGQDERTLFLSQLNPKGSPKVSVPLREVAGLDAVVGAAFGPVYTRAATPPRLINARASPIHVRPVTTQPPR